MSNVYFILITEKQGATVVDIKQQKIACHKHLRIIWLLKKQACQINPHAPILEREATPSLSKNSLPQLPIVPLPPPLPPVAGGAPAPSASPSDLVLCGRNLQ